MENQELWQQIIETMHPHDVHWVKVKGHSGHVLNDRVDALAVAESEKIKNSRL